MNLTIDYREQRSGILKLQEEKPEIHIQFQNLEMGDYIVDRKICFERKTLTDLLASIKNGRFFRQSYRVLDCHTPYILIIEGRKKEIADSGMKREAVQSALLHIALFLGIPILRSKNIDETLSLMIKTSMQLQHNVNIQEYRVYSPTIKPKKRNLQKMKLQILQCLPGIGHNKAKALLKQFGNLRNVFNTDEKD